jgi:hypothetical protein
MSSQNSQPKWWQLYLTFPLLIGLFMVDFRLKLSPHGHQIVQIGIILFVFALIHLWLKANETALSNMDRVKHKMIITIFQSPLSNGRGPRSILRLPDSEIKGVLGDVFEMEPDDIKTLSMDEVSQEIYEE